jgi:hypothetical protein
MATNLSGLKPLRSFHLGIFEGKGVSENEQTIPEMKLKSNQRLNPFEKKL